MSRSIDIAGEYTAHFAAVAERHRARLAQLGLIAPAKTLGFVGVARVVGLESGIYEPAQDGEMAIIFPVFDGPALLPGFKTYLDDPHRLIDLVAWRPQRPALVATRLGYAAALGAWNIEAALRAGDAVTLFRDPGAWARARCDGGVVIDWRADIGLLSAKSIITEDIKHGLDVKRQLKKLREALLRRVPQIRVRIADG